MVSESLAQNVNGLAPADICYGCKMIFHQTSLNKSTPVYDSVEASLLYPRSGDNIESAHLCSAIVMADLSCKYIVATI